MKATLNKIEITAEESATLKAAQTVAEQIWLRFRAANEGYDHRLEMRMEVKEAIMGDPHCWWSVHPMRDLLESGHAMTLEASFSTRSAVSRRRVAYFRFRSA